MSTKIKEEDASSRVHGGAPLSHFSFRQFLKNSFLVSLPHLALLLIFSLYVLFGAAILKEIESDRPLANETSITNPIEDVHIEVTPSNNLNFDQRVNEYTKQLSQFYDEDFNQFKDYNEKLTFIYNKFLLKFNKIVNINEDAKSTKNKDPNGLNDKNETESIKILSSFYNKKKNKINVTEMFKAIAQNLIDFRRDLKENLDNDVRNLFNEYHLEQSELKKEFKSLLKSRVVVFDTKLKEIENIFKEIRLNKQESNLGKKATINIKEKLDMKTSIYFMGSLLTTIGYGDVRPCTILGKLFIMFYVILGIPLTLILLSDLSSVFTRICKFLYAFLIIFFNDGYYERLVQAANEKRKNLFAGSQQETRKRKLKRSKSIDQSDDNFNDEDEENKEKSQNEPSLFLSICELAAECYEQNDDAFDLSLGFLFAILFSYLSFGAIINSRVADWTLFNGYYFSLITFTRIGLGDLTLGNTKFILLSSLYTLFGIACFDLTIQNLREKLRLILINNGQNIVNETIKFVNQFGYEWNIESVNFNLGVNNTIAVAKTQAVEAAKLNEKITSLKRPIKAIDAKLNTLKEVKKCDKQTQITTLLYTKFRLEKASSPKVGHAEKSIASVRPNSSHTREPLSATNQKVEEIPEPIKKAVTEEEFLNSFSSIETNNNVKSDEKVSISDENEQASNVTFKLSRFKEDKPVNGTEKIIDKDKEVAPVVTVHSPENDINTSITLRRNRFSTNNSTSTTASTTPIASTNHFQTRTNNSRFK